MVDHYQCEHAGQRRRQQQRRRIILCSREEQQEHCLHQTWIGEHKKKQQQERIILTRLIWLQGVVKTGIKLKCRHFYCLSNTTRTLWLKHPSLVLFDRQPIIKFANASKIHRHRKSELAVFGGILWRSVDQVHREALIQLIIDQMKVYTISTELQCLYSDIAPYISRDTGLWREEKKLCMGTKVTTAREKE